MSRETAVVLLMVCAYAAAVVGCAERPRAEWLGYAETVAQPTLRAPGSDRPEAFAPASRPGLGGPMVNIKARFISAPPDLIAGLMPPKNDARMRISSAAEVADAIAALQSSPRARVLAAPRLAVFSGQTALVTVETQSAFLRDLRATRGEAGPSFEPVIDAIPEGVRLTVSAMVEGDTCVLTQVEAVATRRLGLRECAARSARTDSAGELKWHEAIFAKAATSVGNPCSIRLEKEQCLLLRMPQAACQTVGNARLYARGPVVERMEMAEGPNEPGPAELETVLVIEATAVRK
jgi:hypothetical protein